MSERMRSSKNELGRDGACRRPLVAGMSLLLIALFAGCDAADAPAATTAADAPTGTTAADALASPSAAPAVETSAATSTTTPATDPAAPTAIVPPAGATPPATAPAAAPPPAPVTRPRLASAPRGGVQEVTFDTIKFPMEKTQAFDRKMFTPEIEALMGQPIRIRGYILPSFQQTGITQFVLVRDNLQCCFGPGAALFDCIIVEMKPGKTTDYTVRPVSVEGKFSFSELINPDDGKHLAIYHLDGDKVQ